MARQFLEDRLVLATHNRGKLEEIRALLAPLSIAVTSAGELDLTEPDETGDSFEDNALLKAKAAVDATGLPALADDSGLIAHELAAPGVHTARWAGPLRDFKLAMRRLRDELASRHEGDFHAADRAASFVAVLCLAWPDGDRVFIRGEVHGLLVDPPRGQGGFGFDPMFQPEGQQLTFAEMTPKAKSLLSHRARAVRLLIERHFRSAAERSDGQLPPGSGV